MTTYHDLTGFQRDCLQAIAAVEGEPYGLALKDWLDDRYSEVVKHPRLYHNLDQLEAEGLVTTTDSDTDDARRKVYHLTDTGERLLEAHAGEVARFQPQDTLVTDGGVDTNSIDPFVCPRSHHSVTLNATRFSCQTCYERGHEPSNWDKTALVDLREERPPEADDDRLVTDGGVTPHASAEPGEALYTTTDGGAVAARVHDLELGEATTSVTVAATDIAAAVDTHHHDDYPSVYIQTDGQQLAITDHASPIAGADVPDWETVDADVVSKPVLTQPDAVVQPLVSRDALRAALDEFAVDAAVTVLVEVDRPIYVTDGDTAVGIAPQVAREALPTSGGGVDA